MSLQPSRILVLGATGDAGLCLLRELLSRQHPTVAYVRNESKIPDDLKFNDLLTVIQGRIDDRDALSRAISDVSIVTSLLGPQSGQPIPPFGEYYETVIFPAMREKNIKRIIAVSTNSAFAPEDSNTWQVAPLVLLVRLMAPGAIPAVRAIARAFVDKADDLEWTVARLPYLNGSSSADAWKRERRGKVQAEFIGRLSRPLTLNRNALATWIVDLVENGQGEWIRKLPCVGSIA